MTIQLVEEVKRPCYLGYKVFIPSCQGKLITPYADALLEFNKWIKARMHYSFYGFHFWSTKKAAETHLSCSFHNRGVILKVKARKIIKTGFGGVSLRTAQFRIVCAKEIFIIKED